MINLEFKSGTEVASVELEDLTKLRAWFREQPWPARTILVNLVSNEAGTLVGDDGTSQELSNEYDLQALIAFRERSDAILTTAKTARAEQYRATTNAALMIVSRQANFDDIPAVQQKGDQRQVLASRKKKLATANAQGLADERDLVALPRYNLFYRFSFKRLLDRLGFSRVVCESGAEYAKFMVKTKTADLLSLTVTGTHQPAEKACAQTLSVLGCKHAKLIWQARIDDTLFTRWELHPIEKDSTDDNFIVVIA